MKSIGRAFGYLRPYWLLEIPALVCALAGTVANLAFPWITKILIDDVFVHRSLASLNFCTLAFGGTILLSAALGA